MTNQEILTLLQTAACNEYAMKEILPKWDESEQVILIYLRCVSR